MRGEKSTPAPAWSLAAAIFSMVVCFIFAPWSALGPVFDLQDIFRHQGHLAAIPEMIGLAVRALPHIALIDIFDAHLAREIPAMDVLIVHRSQHVPGAGIVRLDLEDGGQLILVVMTVHGHQADAARDLDGSAGIAVDGGPSLGIGLAAAGPLVGLGAAGKLAGKIIDRGGAMAHGIDDLQMHRIVEPGGVLIGVAEHDLRQLGLGRGEAIADLPPLRG